MKGYILVKNPIYHQLRYQKESQHIHHNVSEGMVVKVLEHLFISPISGSRGSNTIIEAL
jgi:hypothetical protein